MRLNAGEVIERLSGADGVPAGMRSIGRDTAGRLVVRGAHGDYSADLERVEWQNEVDPGITWAVPVTLPPGLRGRLVEAYRGKGLPLERVLESSLQRSVITPGQCVSKMHAEQRNG